MATIKGEATVYHRADYTLNLFVGDALIAELVQNPLEGSFQLHYTDAWRRSERGFALAPALPLQGAPDPGGIRRFLENLLPEGDALDDLSRAEAISRSNVFGLIRHLGRETTGAIGFLPPGLTPGAIEPRAREIPWDELRARIADRAQTPFTQWDGRVRMSVAGQQDKILVQKVGARLFLVDGSLSSTHILKPEPRHKHLHHMVANEHYCMQLARRISEQAYRSPLTAEVEILRLPDPVLCVRRFDRQEHPTDTVAGVAGGLLPQVQRMHIIDACQALDMPVSMKYERNLGGGRDVAHIRDGVSLPRVYALRPLLESPAVGLRHITFWSVLTLLLGNSDAHGKNLSFEVRPGGLAVTPLYDLVSVLQYDERQIDHELAMAFGDAFRFEEVTPFELAHHCERSGIDRRFFARELRQLCQWAQAEAITLAQAPDYTEDERGTVSSIAQGVLRRARQLEAMADAVPRFAKDLF
jgi:serine/threonine-protein kinase HipA